MSLPATVSSSGGDGDCFEFTLADEELLEFFSFWVEGVALVTVSVLGLVANSISVFILKKPDLQNLFSHLLMVLIIFDSLYIFFSILEAFRRNFEINNLIHTYLFPYLFPVHSLVMTTSIFMTIAMAVERYQAVLFPMRLHLTLHSSHQSYRKRLCKYVLVVIFSAVLITIPRFFEMEIVNEPADQFNPRIIVTSLRMDPLYSLIYINITRFIFTGIGPILLLVFFHYKIYCTVRLHNTDNILADTLQSESILRRKQENSLAKLFINIILAFIICHTPRVLISVREMMVIHNVDSCNQKGMSPYGVSVQVAVCFSHLMLVTNASINMVFYIWNNKTFKQHFMALFMRQMQGGQQQPNLTTLTHSHGIRTVVYKQNTLELQETEL